MKTEVELHTIQILQSLKRNTIGKALVAVVAIGVIYYQVHIGLITLLTGFGILGLVYILAELLNYYVVYSILIDRALFDIRTRFKTI